MAPGNQIPCPCSSCKGLKVLSEKTVQRHISQSQHSQPPVKRQKADDDKDYLHKWTTITSFTLCLRILTLYNDFAGMTQQSINEVLKLIVDVLGTLIPDGKVPLDFKSLQNFMNTFMTPQKRMTACPQECQLFDGDEHKCRNIKCKDGTGKTYHYVPLIPRLKQLYANPNIARMMQNHGHNARNEMMDIQDSPEWKDLYGKGGLFEGDHRAIALEFSADGFSPFHHTTSKPYSIEQQASIILNLPPDMRTKAGFVLLHGLIPGPQSPKEEKYNIYLRPLVDELKELEKGIEAYDAYRDELFVLRATILLHVHDFPGQAKAFHNYHSGGKFACPMCKAEGTYETHLSKTIYRSGREFLEADDKLRHDASFPGGRTEDGTPKLRDFAGEKLLAAACGTLEDQMKSSLPRSKERRVAKAAVNSIKAMGIRKRCSEFDRLGDKEAGKIAVEGMHTIQGVGKNLHGILNGYKDNAGVRAHEESINRFPGCAANDRGHLPPAPFTLTKADMIVADERMEWIAVPPGKGSLPKAPFVKFHSMKSHTWHLMMTKGVYPYVMRGLLGIKQRSALVKFCHIMAVCAARCIHSDLVPRMGKNLHRCMAIMDREFPETLKTILWHMLHHFPRFLERFGPIHSYWMFYFERQIHHHVSRLHNSRHPEASMINSYRTDALCALMQYVDLMSEEDTAIQESAREDSGMKTTYTYSSGKWTWKGHDRTGSNGSIIYARSESGCVRFGRIGFFYEFGYGKELHRFASVHWFDSPTEDPQSRLYSCNVDTHDTSVNPTVPLDELSEPLITALDGKDMYILDFLDRDRVIELMDWLESDM